MSIKAIKLNKKTKRFHLYIFYNINTSIKWPLCKPRAFPFQLNSGFTQPPSPLTSLKMQMDVFYIRGLKLPDGHNDFK